MRREGGYAPKCTSAYSQGGSVKNFDIFEYVINKLSLTKKACKTYEIQKQPRRCTIEIAFSKILLFRRKTLVLSLLLITLQAPGLQLCEKQTAA